jgi:AraC-like DNA-binding protein
MSFGSSFLNSIILLGSIQGFLIGVLLYVSSKEKPSGKLLAWLLLILALACLKIYLNNIGLASTQVGSLIDAFVPFMIIMPVGPLIYFYCKTELSSSFKIQRKDRLHFYPVVIDLFHHASAVVFLIVLLLGWANPQKNNFGVWFDTYNVYADIPRWISLCVYLLLSFRLVNSAVMKARLQNEVTPSSLSWLKEFLWVFLVFAFLWLTYLIPYIIPKYTDSILNSLDWYPIYLPIVAIIYWLGIRGFLIGRKEMSSLKKSTLNLSAEATEQIMQGLLKSMTDDKLYLDAELNLTKLAQHLGTSPKTISAVLNQKLGKSFNEYVNHYRIEEIKLRLVKAENKKYTIAALAYECGFNSQPTFQRAFKSIVGITPSEFLQKNGDHV